MATIQSLVASPLSVRFVLTVEINGRHYMDGGIVSHLNATSIAPADEVARLRHATTVIAIDPDFGELTVTQAQMMDASVVRHAVQIGRQQAGVKAASILRAWND